MKCLLDSKGTISQIKLLEVKLNFQTPFFPWLTKTYVALAVIYCLFFLVVQLDIKCHC